MHIINTFTRQTFRMQKLMDLEPTDVIHHIQYATNSRTLILSLTQSFRTRIDNDDDDDEDDNNSNTNNNTILYITIVKHVMVNTVVANRQPWVVHWYLMYTYYKI